MKTVLTAIATLVAVLLGALMAALLGLPRVAATTPQGGALDWYLDMAKDRAVETRAADVSVPDLSDPAMAQAGYSSYEAMCIACHGGPGVEGSPLAKGLNPAPTDLQAFGPYDDERAAEAFWVIKHGIRMTGMPAFGPTHEDRAIWEIVAFLQRFESMSAEDFERVAMGGPVVPGADVGDESTGDGHDHEH